MKRFFLVVGVLLTLCACNTNSPSSDIYAPVTQEETEKITERFNENYECLYDWLKSSIWRNSELDLSILEIRSAQKNDASTIALNTSRCFGNTYAYGASEIANGEFVDKSHLNQRVYIVNVSLNRNETTTIYFDKHFELIPAPINAAMGCGCDCWK